MRLENAVKEAVADGRVSEEERRVIWCVANQNNLLVTLQILCFVALFGFVVYYFDKVCSQQLYSGMKQLKHSLSRNYE